MEEKDYVTRREFSQLDKRTSRNERTLERHETKIEYIEYDLKDIKDNTKKIIWLIVSTIVLALLNMLMTGGVN